MQSMMLSIVSPVEKINNLFICGEKSLMMERTAARGASTKKSANNVRLSCFTVR